MDFIRDVLAELHAMAVKKDAVFLAHLIGMAAIEAREISSPGSARDLLTQRNQGQLGAASSSGLSPDIRQT